MSSNLSFFVTKLSEYWNQLVARIKGFFYISKIFISTILGTFSFS